MTEARRFQGKVVLITGAASGFGRRAAERFAGEGANLVLGDIQDHALEVTAEMARKAGAKVVTRVTNVTSAAAVEALVRAAVETFGRLDIALNNAGIAHGSVKIQDTDDALMRKMLDVNVMGVFHGLKAQIPVMEKQGSGVILNTASVAGITGAPLLGAYAAAKHAVIGLTKTAAAETARKGVRVNAICPAFAETPMLTDALIHKDASKEEALARLVQAVPMRRPGTADEIVQAMLWICSPENSFMTGHALVLDGGLTAL
ncbi:SDR family NAD(P)-dependent oxidoreductase [Phreatobacter stygius]|nr:SDR family oxidoreductase [Phreatobacter stygius]